MIETAPTPAAVVGLGRIGTLTTRILIDRPDLGLEVEALNNHRNLTPESVIDSLVYDSTHGHFMGHTIQEVDDTHISVDGRAVQLVPGKKALDFNWKEVASGLTVIEATGAATTTKAALGHIASGAGAVVITSPATDTETPTIVIGVNDTEENLAKAGNIVAVSSCSTNCIAPVLKVLKDTLDISWAKAQLTHAFTNSQRSLDGLGDKLTSQRPLRDVTPASSGSTKEVARLLDMPSFDSSSNRVPVPDGSLVDLLVVVKGTVTTDNILEILGEAVQQDHLRGVIQLTDIAHTSSRVIGNPFSSIIETSGIKTKHVDGNTVVDLRLWFDNEWGYSNRVAEVAAKIAKFI